VFGKTVFQGNGWVYGDCRQVDGSISPALAEGPVRRNASNGPSCATMSSGISAQGIPIHHVPQSG